MCGLLLSQCEAVQQDELLQSSAQEVDPHVQGVSPHAQGVGQVVPGCVGSMKVIVHEADRWSGPTTVSLSQHAVDTASMNADSHKKCLISVPFAKTLAHSRREWPDAHPRARER